MSNERCRSGHPLYIAGLFSITVAWFSEIPSSHGSFNILPATLSRRFRAPGDSGPFLHCACHDYLFVLLLRSVCPLSIRGLHFGQHFHCDLFRGSSLRRQCRLYRQSILLNGSKCGAWPDHILWISPSEK